MILETNVITSIEINGLEDLPRLKALMENTNMKINKTQIGREMGKDPRTVAKYLDGYKKPTTRNKGSVLDPYHDTIENLLKSDTQRFFYKCVLYRYLKDNHQLDVPESTFRHYIASHPEFDSYFRKSRQSNAEQLPVIRYETPLGKQAQLDWKESITFKCTDIKEDIKINVLVIILSCSRCRLYYLTMRKTKDILFDRLIAAFESFGGVPHELLTDNMSTVMDDARTLYSDGKVNDEFAAFAKDMGFEVHPCVAASPETKAKVESPMKILDELRAYSGTLTYVQLNDKLAEINSRVNTSINQGTGRIPAVEFEKEKGSLLPLPNESIRNHYKIKSSYVKVNTASMVTYKRHQYSVPPEYLGKMVAYQVHDSMIHVYFNTKLIACHRISESMINYDLDHYEQVLKLNYPNKDSDEIRRMAKENLKSIGELYA